MYMYIYMYMYTYMYMCVFPRSCIYMYDCASTVAVTQVSMCTPYVHSETYVNVHVCYDCGHVEFVRLDMWDALMRWLTIKDL